MNYGREKDFVPEDSGILALVGNTPVVRLQSDRWGTYADIFLKLESFNPWLSIKDRAAKSMVLSAERSGALSKGGAIVEATTGNTGISLAAIAASRGYRATIVMPDYVSRERMILLTMLGAELVLTPSARGYAGTVERAKEIADTTGAYYIDQSSNPANPAAHHETGAEIWAQMHGSVDYFIAGVGTGGHISGAGRYLKSLNGALKVIAVEPDGAALLSGRTSQHDAKSTHGILGIGPGLIFDNTDMDVISEVFVTNKEDAYQTAREVIRREGILVGISTGATMHAALDIARRKENEGKRLLCMAPSQTERYLSTGLAAEANAKVDALLENRLHT